MATLFRPFLTARTLGLGLGLSLASTQVFRQPRIAHLDSHAAAAAPFESYSRNAKTPVVINGRLNSKAVRQVSSGSIIGLCSGLVVSTFSRSLTLLIGLLVVGVQWAESYGIHIVPYKRLQRYVTSVDFRSAVEDNVAFKLSFGSTFALASFVRFSDY